MGNVHLATCIKRLISPINNSWQAYSGISLFLEVEITPFAYRAALLPIEWFHRKNMHPMFLDVMAVVEV